MKTLNLFQSNCIGFTYRALDKREYLIIIRDNFVDSASNISCDPSSELSHRDSLDEGSHYMLSVRNKKSYPSIIINTPSYLELWARLFKASLA